MTANGDFVEGQVGWNGGNAHTIGTEPAPTFTPTASWNGAANVLVNSSNARKDIRGRPHQVVPGRSEEHTSELQSLMRISYAVFCLKKKNTYKYHKAVHFTCHITKHETKTSTTPHTT